MVKNVALGRVRAILTPISFSTQETIAGVPAVRIPVVAVSMSMMAAREDQAGIMNPVEEDA